MSTPAHQDGNERLWPTDKLTALRTGQRLVSEVPVRRPNRRAFVDTIPVTTPADTQARQGGWKRADHARAFWGGSARARVSARCRASGSRYRPVMRRTKVRGVGGGHPGRGDEQRPGRGSALDGHRVDSGAVPGSGHADHRDAELGARMRAQAGPAVRVKIGVAVDDQQAQPAQVGQDRAAAGARAGRTRPAGSGVPGAGPRCAQPARVRRRPARLRPGRRRCPG